MNFKTKRSIVAFFLLLVLLLSMSCGGCGQDTKDDDDLATTTTPAGADVPTAVYPIPNITDSKRAEIIDAAYAKYADQLANYAKNDISIRYFGTYGDAVALFLDLPTEDFFDERTEETVGDCIFEYASAQTLTIYYKNEFYSLTDAHDSGVLNQNGLKELHSVYAAYLEALGGGRPVVNHTGPFDPEYVESDPIVIEPIYPIPPISFPYQYEPLPLSAEEENEIRYAAYKDPEISGGCKEEDIIVKSLGRYSSSYVVVVTILGKHYKEVMTNMLIYDYEFNFPSWSMPMIYKDGVFFEISYAVHGLMTEDDVRIFHGVYNGYPVLSQMGKIIIEKDWQSYFMEDPDWTGIKYYGTYSDCSVFFVPGLPDENWTQITVGDYGFLYETPFEIFVHVGSKFITLEEAYKFGYISDDQLRVISKRHAEFFSK